MSDWIKDGPKDFYYSTSESGWMEQTNFFEWFKSVFIKHITENCTGPTLYFY